MQEQPQPAVQARLAGREDKLPVDASNDFLLDDYEPRSMVLA
jgi:hypothetical protein